MGVLLIFFTFSLGIIVSYVLFQYNSGKNTSSIHPSLLKLRELEQSSLNKDNSKKSKKSSVPEFDLNGELFPLYHNEEEYPILTNDIRKERTKEITNIMIQTVKDVTADNASTEQIMFDLELTGNAQITIYTFFEQGFLNDPPANYYITPISPESESEQEDTQSEHEIHDESPAEHSFDHETNDSLSSNSGQHSGLYESINSMYLNPQNLLEVYNVSLDKDYDSGKDSSMKMKAKSMILKARKNMEKLDQSNSLRK